MYVTLERATGGTVGLDITSVVLVRQSWTPTASGAKRYTIYTKAADGVETTIVYSSENDRDADFEVLKAAFLSQPASNKVGATHMISEVTTDLKGYIKANKDLIYTVLFVLIADHFFFNGAFRERVRSLVDRFLRRAEDRAAAGVGGRTIEATATRVE